MSISVMIDDENNNEFEATTADEGGKHDDGRR